LKKKLRTGREFVDTWHAQLQTWRVKYKTSICDNITKIFKKIEKNFTFCDRTFYNKSKIGRFQADVSCWTCGNPKLKLRTRSNSKQATWNLKKHLS
jgi:hypothetical protein